MTLQRWAEEVFAMMPSRYGSVMLGSGDFHHLSLPLIRRLPAFERVQVVVLDNHPDNMRFPFGVHCGSWVNQVAQLKHVEEIHVVGITSRDISSGHAWENYLQPLWKGRLHYWHVGVETRWASWLGLSSSFHRFESMTELAAAFIDRQKSTALPTYLSIDKDVFSADVARTNWDQGSMLMSDALTIIAGIKRVVASDSTGETSEDRYQSWLKRRLSAMDNQPAIDSAQLAVWQRQQHELNLQLLEAIAARSY